MKKMEISPETLPIASFEINTNDDPTLETISLTLFVAGCARRCHGCQNPGLQEVNNINHKLFFLDEVQELIENRLCLIGSVCFCGGDFLPLYKLQLKKLIEFCKSRSLRTILYTGELFENIDEYFKNNIDIIVDGPYDQMKRTNKFPASSNQRCWINGVQAKPESLEINKGNY
jgi:anaerobic ribonucleoside-triphosphate reductase activating protein